MDHHKTYQAQADLYEQLISREDYCNNLLPEILKIYSFNDKDVLELGAGTGRLTRMLAPLCRSMIACDLSFHMLQFNQRILKDLHQDEAKIITADHRFLPLKNDVADVAISGWSIGYLVDWYRASWKTELTKAFSEINLLLRKHGMVIIIETMGTGFENPTAPSHLVNYYDFLKSIGFSYTWIRTDYQFYSIEEAIYLTNFFFGNELAAQVKEKNLKVLPECTGIWWKSNQK